jgi:acetylglutamate kinase
MPVRCTVKLGGSILEEDQTRAAIVEQVVQLSRAGVQVILVHGGGKSLSRRLAELNLPSRFVSGLRVTDAATLQVAVMVLAGEVNKRLVAEFGRRGARAVGLCGADAGAVRCVPLRTEEDVDLGFVGKPVAVEAGFFDQLLAAGIIPIVSSIAAGEDWQLYNVNADQVASVCAWGTGCEALVYLTDVAGVRDENGAVISNLDRARIGSLRQTGVIKGGMLPKTESCLEALTHGVDSVFILPGAASEVLVRFIKGALTEGTVIHG